MGIISVFFEKKEGRPFMRGFFARIRNGFQRMMYGRNGADALCMLLMCLYLILWVASIVAAALDGVIACIVIWCLQMLVLSYWLFRVFSKNTVKRRNEVTRFFGFFRRQRNRFRDRRTHVYKKCPSCRAVLRLPKKKGKHTVCCPACKERFSVKIRRSGKPKRQKNKT